MPSALYVPTALSWQFCGWTTDKKADLKFSGHFLRFIDILVVSVGVLLVKKMLVNGVG